MESSLRKQLEMDDDDYWNQSNKFKRIFDDEEPSKKSKNLFDDDDDDDTGKRAKRGFIFVGVKGLDIQTKVQGFIVIIQRWDFHHFTPNAQSKHYISQSLM